MSNSQIEALVIHCIDYRFVSKQRDFLVSNSLVDSYDLLVYPGASKFIEKLQEAIEISVRLHNPKKVLLIDHQDCGAFGENNSIQNHRDSLKRAEDFIKSKHPRLLIEKYLAKFEGIEKI